MRLKQRELIVRYCLKIQANKRQDTIGNGLDLLFNIVVILKGGRGGFCGLRALYCNNISNGSIKLIAKWQPLFFIVLVR